MMTTADAITICCNLIYKLNWCNVVFHVKNTGKTTLFSERKFCIDGVQNKSRHLIVIPPLCKIRGGFTLSWQWYCRSGPMDKTIP